MKPLLQKLSLVCVLMSTTQTYAVLKEAAELSVVKAIAEARINLIQGAKSEKEIELYLRKLNYAAAKLVNRAEIADRVRRQVAEAGAIAAAGGSANPEALAYVAAADHCLELARTIFEKEKSYLQACEYQNSDEYSSDRNSMVVDIDVRDHEITLEVQQLEKAHDLFLSRRVAFRMKLLPKGEREFMGIKF